MVIKFTLKKNWFKVVTVGYHSLKQSPEEIVESISKQIDECCKNITTKVNFVGHSLGGLMIRAYLQDNKLTNLGRVVFVRYTKSWF